MIILGLVVVCFSVKFLFAYYIFGSCYYFKINNIIIFIIVIKDKQLIDVRVVIILYYYLRTRL